MRGNDAIDAVRASPHPTNYELPRNSEARFKEWVMISNSDVAKGVADLLLEFRAKLDASIARVQTNCSAEESERYKGIVDGIMARMADLMDHARPPEPEPSELSVDEACTATRNRIREIEERALKRVRLKELDARDQLLVTLWRDGKIGYRDALIYATSWIVVRVAISEEMRKRKRGGRGDGGLSAPVAGITPPKGPAPLTSAAPLEDDEGHH